MVLSREQSGSLLIPTCCPQVIKRNILVLLNLSNRLFFLQSQTLVEHALPTSIKNRVTIIRFAEESSLLRIFGFMVTCEFYQIMLLHLIIIAQEIINLKFFQVLHWRSSKSLPPDFFLLSRNNIHCHEYI